MKNFLLSVLFFGCIVQNFYAQEKEDGVASFVIPPGNSLKFNSFVINPTFSFVRQQSAYVTLFNKTQWAGFENAPTTYMLSYSGRFKENEGVGLSVFQQNQGLLTTFGVVANFAHNILLQEDSNLTFGLNLSAYKSGLNSGKVVSNYPDPSLDNIPSNTVLTINPGINYGTGFFDFGLGFNNLISYNFKTGILKDDPNKGIEGHVMYTGFMDSYGFFDKSKFSGIVKTELNKEQTVISGSAVFTIPKGIWAQAGYNSVLGMTAGVGLNITPKIAFEYSYGMGLGDISNLGASHIIVLAYKFKNDNFDYGDDEEEGALIEPAPIQRAAVTKPKTDTKAIADAKIAQQVKAAELNKAKLAAANKAKADAAMAASKAKLAADAKAKSDAEAILQRNKLAADAKAKADADAIAAKKAEPANKAKLAADAKTKADADASAKLIADAKAKALAESNAKLAAEAKLAADTKAKADAAAAKEKLIADAKIKADADAASKLATEKKAKEDAIVKAKLVADAKAKADADASAKLAVDNKAKQDAATAAKLAADAKVKADADAAAKLAADAKAKADADATAAKLTADARAKADADAAAKLAADAKAKADADATAAKLTADARAKADADAAAKLAADNKAKADAALATKLAADAKAKADADAAAKLAADAKAKADADATAAKLTADARAKADADAAAKLAADAKAKADADATAAKLTADAKAKADADAAAKLVADNKAKADAAIAAKLAADAKAKADADAAAKLAADNKAKADADAAAKLAADNKAKADAAIAAKLAADAKAKADADAAAKLAADNKAKADAAIAAKLAADAKAKADADAAAKLAADNKAKADAAIAAKLAADAKAKADADAAAKLAADNKAKADAAIAAKLAADAKAKADADAAAKLAADNKAKADAAIAAKLAADAKAKADADAAAKLAADNKAKADAAAEQDRIEAAAAAKLAIEALAKAKADAMPKDDIGKSMDNLSKTIEDTKRKQQQLLSRLDASVANKEKALKDLKEENDLSDKGIVKTTVEFKSTAGENAELEAIKAQIAQVNKDQAATLEQFNSLYNERLKKAPKNDLINQNYLKTIDALKADQLKAEQTNAALITSLEKIKVETEIEKKRRIKRAASLNDQDRFAQDAATLKRIKETTKVSAVPLTTSDFDFGDSQANMQIMKNVKNVQTGYYLILAVHSDAQKRDVFVTKTVASGQKEVNFFYDSNSSKYYIYDATFDNLEEATQALQAKGNKAYKSKMVIVKIDK